MTPAAIYARYSSSNQRDESIEDQLRECHRFAEREGLTVVAEFTDHAKSGRSTEKRTEFRKMIEAAKTGLFKTLIIYKMNRFARSMYDFFRYEHELIGAGVEVVSVKEPMFSGPAGTILKAVLAGVAQSQSEAMSEDIKRALEGNALKCRSNGRKPWGYVTDPEGHFAVDEEKAAAVRTIFEGVLSGVTVSELADELNAKGFRTTRGNAFCVQTVSKMLRNETYTGVYRFKNFRKDGGVPAIVDMETFEKVQVKLNGHVAGKKRGASAKFLLTPKIICGKCGEKIRGMSGRGRHGDVHHYYRCRGKQEGRCDLPLFRKAELERIVVSAVWENVLAPEKIPTIVDAVMAMQERENAKKMTADVTAERKRLAEIEKEIDRLLDSVAKGIPAERVAGKVKELEAQSNTLAAAIRRAESQAAETHYSRDFVEKALRVFAKGDLNSEDYRRNVIDALVEGVLIDGENAVIFLSVNKEKTNRTNKIIVPVCTSSHLVGLSCAGQTPVCRDGFIILKVPLAA